MIDAIVSLRAIDQVNQAPSLKIEGTVMVNGIALKQCVRCHGDVYTDLDGEATCIQCGRPASWTKTDDQAIRVVVTLGPLGMVL